MHRNSNGFGVFARAYVRNSIGRNAQMYFLRKSSKGVVPFSNLLLTSKHRGNPPKKRDVTYVISREVFGLQTFFWGGMG